MEAQEAPTLGSSTSGENQTREHEKGLQALSVHCLQPLGPPVYR